MFSLNFVDLLRNLYNLGNAAFKRCGQCGLGIGLFLKNECGQKRDDFLGLVLGQDVLKYQLGEDQLVGGVYLEEHVSNTKAELGTDELTSHATLPFSSTREPSSTKPSSRSTCILCS